MYLPDPFITSSNGLFLTELALQGAGIAVRSKWDIAEHIKAGRLVEVLKKFPLESYGDVYLVTGARKALSARVKLFIEFVLKN